MHLNAINGFRINCIFKCHMFIFSVNLSTSVVVSVLGINNERNKTMPIPTSIWKFLAKPAKTYTIVNTIKLKPP